MKSTQISEQADQFSIGVHSFAVFSRRNELLYKISRLGDPRITSAPFKQPPTQQLLSPLILPHPCSSLVTEEQEAAQKPSWQPRQGKAESWHNPSFRLFFFFSFFSGNLEFSGTGLEKYRLTYLNI